MNPTNIDRMILERLRDCAPKARRLTTLSQLVGIDRLRTAESLRRLMQQGRVIYNGRGAYRAAR